MCESGSQLPTEQHIVTHFVFVFPNITSLISVCTSSDGGLHGHRGNWDIRVLRHQQLYLHDAGRGERGKRAHPAGQPWT